MLMRWKDCIGNSYFGEFKSAIKTLVLQLNVSDRTWLDVIGFDNKMELSSRWSTNGSQCLTVPALCVIFTGETVTTRTHTHTTHTNKAPLPWKPHATTHTNKHTNILHTARLHKTRSQLLALQTQIYQNKLPTDTQSQIKIIFSITLLWKRLLVAM